MSSQSDLFPSSLIDSFVTSISLKKGLNETLTELAKYIEEKSSVPVYASILILDESGKHLYRGAAPSLPEEYSKQVDGIEIGPSQGSCGTAVYCKHPIYVVDIDRDQLWSAYKELAISHGLRACWSYPILSKAGAVLGTFALYYSVIRNPTLEERQFIQECARNAAILIEKSREPRS